MSASSRPVRSPRDCIHDDFDAMVIVTRLEDSGRWQADFQVNCKTCGTPFTFLGDLPVGVDLNGIATNFTQTELRAGITPQL